MIQLSSKQSLFVLFALLSSCAAHVEQSKQQLSYSVTDVAKLGLNSQQLFDEMQTSWMDLHHSICANRALVWSYDLFRKRKVEAGRIFIFFSEKVWENDKSNNQWAYHAGTYIVENGKELVLEGSYPDEVKKPLTLVEWFDNEMEGRAEGRLCLEITEKDTDLTEYFYTRANLPSRRENGLPSAPCYYRKAPGYIAYPIDLAQLDFQKDERGKKINYSYSEYDLATVMNACVDSATGRKFLNKGKSRNFCKYYLQN